MLVHSTNDSRPSTVTSSGSAVMIQPGYALTAAHVVPVSSLQSMYLIEDGKSIEATPVKIDRDRDIALLSLKLGCPCIPLATKAPAVDEQVYTIGYPMYLSYGVEFLTTGTVQGTAGGNLISTATTAPGGSGGAMFVRDGTTFKVGGITVAIATTTVGPTLLGYKNEYNWVAFSVPAPVVRAFLAGTPAANNQ